MAATNHERIGKALGLLSDGLAPFVAQELGAKYGPDWVSTVARADAPFAAGKRVSPTDAQFLLKVLWDEWQNVFRLVLGQSERTYVSELRDVRNRWAHQETFSTDDAYRSLDTMHRLLLAVSAADQAVEVDRMRQDLLRTRFADQARQTQRRSAVAPVEGQPAGGLRPWRELITPHRDVASGRYQQAEFAADLHQVWRGEAADEYGKPVEFFRRTFLTDGLRTLLLNAVRRFTKAGGDPVVELQTNFGGGKTHSLIALYHLSAGHPANELPGVEAMLAEAGLGSPPKANRAVLVGHWIPPGVVRDHGGGVQVHTLWGEMAWQLGGAEGYDLVAEADRTGTNPGVALVDLLRRYAPCLILIDEWVAYARMLYGVDGLPAGSFDAQFTFAQALAEAARAVEGALLVVSIPSSDIEVGGEGGRAALDRLKNVIGRVESSWRPASAEEGFEIVRRRLFDDLPTASAPDRDAVVKAFAALYRGQSSEFPSGCAEGSYERRLTAAYPIHPELFDRLYGEWSTLDKFQRTRGVLRLMAAVVHELWERNDASLLILPASVPIDAPVVSSELTRYLDEGWTPVIESDIDGPNALPLRLDRENPGLGRYSANRRVARTIYIGSAPGQHAANRGLDDRSIKLGCVQPGESPATFGDALRRLTDQATYLYVDGQRYWYSLQPSVTRLARDRAASNFNDDDADQEIRKRLAGATRPGQRGDFANVHTAPRTPGDVPDEPECRLVVLGPDGPHSAKVADSSARRTAERLLNERAAGARLHRNTLVFLAPDKARLDELRQAAREFLAWKSIEAEKVTLNLDNFQSKQAEAKRGQLDEVVGQRVGETFVWLLVPSQAPDEALVTWEEARVGGPEALAVRVSKKLRGDESLITEYSSARLRMDLDRIPLWRGPRVGLKELWGDYSQYLYLPRLRDSAVLLGAIRSGVAALTWNPDSFAYAEAYDEARDRYRGLAAGQHAAVLLDSTSVIVKPEVAARQLQLESAAAEQPASGANAGEPAQLVASTEAPAPTAPQAASLPKRFYGRVSVPAVRMLRDLGDIADGVIAQLGAGGAEVTLTIDIEAIDEKGFTDEIRRTVTENARTLKFSVDEFETD
ncbi:MAG TPA: Swt1 family HEPN domain-containing protein [Actinomycetota bacterium]|nr:Swt1 family HEPN domain-containing protein [Actinomycetota bacterium]